MKEFAIFKATEKKNEKSPDYNISVKIGEKWTNIGGAWIRESGKGQKFFSCKLSAPYQDRKGYEIVESKPEVKPAAEAMKPFRPETEDSIDPNSIPF